MVCELSGVRRLERHTADAVNMFMAAFPRGNQREGRVLLAVVAVVLPKQSAVLLKSMKSGTFH